MIMPADRLTTLEIRAAEQERTIEELSQQLAEQWKTVSPPGEEGGRADHAFSGAGGADRVGHSGDEAAALVRPP